MAARFGLERAADELRGRLDVGRFALLANQASLGPDFRYAHDILAEVFPGRLATLFAPQHGFWGTEQANMIETPHGGEPALPATLYSLYSETRKPRPEMLRGIEALVIDLQDVGCRVYTFIWTILHCLQACAEAGVRAIVLDRPNPVGGLVEGPPLPEDHFSFVGMAAIPMRHGLTIGEMTCHLNEHLRVGAEVEAVAIEGWRRSDGWPKDRVWTAPSPNLPRLEGVRTYPGLVMLEGTNLSEGRGTTTPFEVVGAPFLEPKAYADALGEFDLKGVKFRPTRFRPTFDKHAGDVCGGVALHVTDLADFRPYRTAVAVMAAAWKLAPGAFSWRPPPYEYEYVKPPIDILAGPELRPAIESRSLRTAKDLDPFCDPGFEHWERQSAPHRLYGELEE
jgi:uncharacterized protein YbbC (DUF1343 family)